MQPLEHVALSTATATPSSSLRGQHRQAQARIRGSALPITRPSPARSSISRSFQLSPMASVSAARDVPALLQEGERLRLARPAARSTSRMPTPWRGIDRALDPHRAAQPCHAGARSSASIASRRPAEHHLQRVVGERLARGRAPRPRRGATGRGSRRAACSRAHALDEQAALAALARSAPRDRRRRARPSAMARAARSARGSGPAAQHLAVLHDEGAVVQHEGDVAAELLRDAARGGIAAPGDQHAARTPARRAPRRPRASVRGEMRLVGARAACRRCRGRAAGSGPRRPHRPRPDLDALDHVAGPDACPPRPCPRPPSRTPCSRRRGAAAGDERDEELAAAGVLARERHAHGAAPVGPLADLARSV